MRAITGELTGEGIYGQFFRGAVDSAVHVEVQDTYRMPDKYEPLEIWRETGEIVQTGGGREWCRLVSDTVTRGVSVRRIRVVTVPHSEYTRWLLDACAPNIEAGEHIRYLPRHLAKALVPADDFWLFDSATVAFNTLDEGGAGEGLAVTTDQGIAEVCTVAAHELWAQGIDHADYMQSEFVDRQQ
ncbi:DUF6879 family protein [Nocardia rhamnosiphila]|uniref:DUF6879 family protein n=1 Tax=Nocardia rhamnosiphila TaxID=426716 RepID=UPI0034047C27